MTSPHDTSLPYEHKGRKQIAENQQFHIYFDHIIGEGGLEVPNFLVVAPKRATPDGITGVAILPVMDGEMGLLRVYRHPIAGWSWEIPRGFVELDEDLLGSVSRELFEETGLECGRENLIALGFITPDAGILAGKIQLFVGTHCKPLKPFAANEVGHTGMQWMNEREIKLRIEKSEIHDPSTLIAFYRYLEIQNAEG